MQNITVQCGNCATIVVANNYQLFLKTAIHDIINEIPVSLTRSTRILSAVSLLKKSYMKEIERVEKEVLLSKPVWWNMKSASSAEFFPVQTSALNYSMRHEYAQYLPKFTDVKLCECKLTFDPAKFTNTIWYVNNRIDLETSPLKH